MIDSTAGDICKLCGKAHPNIATCVQDKGVPLVLGLQAGHCGKCGAPYYQDTYTGALRPICCCWNLPKITFSDQTK